MDILLLGGALLLFGGFVFASVRSIKRWHGGWKLAALVPVLSVLFVAARIVVDTRRDATSHNLWPFEILVAAAIGLAALGVLALGHRASRTHTSTT